MMSTICRIYIILYFAISSLALTESAGTTVKPIFEGYPEWTPPIGGWETPIIDSIDLPLNYKIEFDFYQVPAKSSSTRRQEFEVKLGGDYYNDRVDDLPSITFFTEPNGESSDSYLEITLRTGSRGDPDYTRNAIYLDTPSFGTSPENYSTISISIEPNWMIVEINKEIIGLFQFFNNGPNGQNGCFQIVQPKTHFKCDRNIHGSGDYYAQEFYRVPGYFWAQMSTEAYIRDLVILAL